MKFTFSMGYNCLMNLKPNTSLSIVEYSSGETKCYLKENCSEAVELAQHFLSYSIDECGANDQKCFACRDKTNNKSVIFVSFVK